MTSHLRHAGTVDRPLCNHWARQRPDRRARWCSWSAVVLAVLRRARAAGRARHDRRSTGSPRFDCDLLTELQLDPQPGDRRVPRGHLGTLWVMLATALIALPLGIAAALYLEEFADPNRWYNRFIEVNIQNLAAVPSIVYGLLALASSLASVFSERGLVLGGAVALALLILPVIIITTREALGPCRARSATARSRSAPPSGRPPGGRCCPSAIPGIATGTILALSRAIGEAAPLLLIGHGDVHPVRPERADVPVHGAAPADLSTRRPVAGGIPGPLTAAAIIVLLIMILGAERAGHLHSQQVPANLVRTPPCRLTTLNHRPPAV